MKLLHKKSILGACVGLLVLVGLTGVTTLDLTPVQTPRASAPPLATYLYTIDPNPSTDGFISLTWDAASGADYYRVYRDTSFISSVGSRTPLIDDWYLTYAYDDLSSLGYDTYYYAVIGVNVDGNGSISNCQSVDYVMGAPNMYPSMPQSNGQVMFGWSTVTGAADYSVYRESSPIVSTSGLTPRQPNTTLTMYMDTLTVPGNYYYAVTAFDGISQVTDPSTNFLVMFQTTSLDTIVPNPSSSPTINLNWNDITGADVYMVFWNATAPITEANVMYTSTYYQSYTSSNADNLLTAGTYYYAVLPMQMSGGVYGYGLLSDCESVTYLGGGMPAPSFIPPTVAHANGNVPLTWTSMPYATTYKVYREATPIFDVTGLTAITSTSLLTYTDSLSTQATYYYAVTAENTTDFSNPSMNVAVLFRTTTLNAITPNPTYSASVTLDWNDVPEAEGYYIFRNTTEITEANMFQNVLLGASNISTYVDTLPDLGTYYYAIIPLNMTKMAFGVLSNCESVIYAQGEQLAAPSIYAFFPMADGSVDLSWAPVTGATSYNVYRETTNITDVSLLSPIAEPIGTFYSDTLSVEDQYFYAVTAENATDEGPQSYCYSAIFRTTTLMSITPNPTDSNAIVLDWNDIPEATLYAIFRNTTAITESNMLQQQAIGTADVSTYTDTLTLGSYGTYYYAIIPTDQVSGYGILSNCQSVVYQATVILDAPLIYGMFPLSTGVVNLRWEGVTGATSYNVYRESTPITDVAGLTAIAHPTGLTYTDSLPVQGTYYYAVTAENATDEGPASTPPTGVLYYPVNLAAISPNPTSVNSILLDWNDVTDAFQYYIFRNTTAITEGNIMQQSPLALVNVSTYTDTNMPAYGTYYYAIVPSNLTSAYILGEVSTIQSVIYVALNTPTLDAITPNSTANPSINLNWNDITSATGYYVYRSTSPISSVIGLTPIASPGTSTYVDTLPTTFGPYYYVVVATNGAANGSISNCVLVTYSITTPVLDAISPNPTTSFNINLNWDDVTDATGYYVYRSSTGTITDVTGMTPIVTLGATSAYMDSLTPIFGYYYYVVVATNGYANTSRSNCVSVHYTIATPELDVICPPLSTTPSSTINLNWNDISGALGYHVYRSATGAITDVSSMTPIASPVTSAYVDTLSSFGAYYYVVVATNGFDNTTISSCRSVIYYDAADLEPALLLDITPSPTTSATVNLDWNDVSMADHYHVYRSTSTISDVTGMTPIASPTTSSYADTLPASGTYYYAIVAFNVTADANSTFFNCKSVTYNAPADVPITPPPAGIPGMSPFLVIAILAIAIGPLSRRMRHGSKR